MTDQSLGAIATTRVDAIAQFLEGEKIQYELVEHDPVISAAAEARVAHTPPDQVAKTIVLHDRSAYVIAAIPASYRLDLHKLRELLGATRQLRLAGEGEIAREFPSLEVGARASVRADGARGGGDRPCADGAGTDSVSCRRPSPFGARGSTRRGADHRGQDCRHLPGLIVPTSPGPRPHDGHTAAVMVLALEEPLPADDPGYRRQRRHRW